MGTRINTAAYERFNASFGKFVESKSVEDSTIANVDNNSKFSLNGVSKLKAGTGDYKGNLFRSDKQIADNNSTRARFMSAVADIFGGKNRIPESVKAAMKWDDFDGKGRPLTARRIRATWDQIQVEIKAEQSCVEIRNALSAQDWAINFPPETRAAFNPYINQLTDELSQAMEEILLPDIQQGKVPSVETMKAYLMKIQTESEATTAIKNAINTNADKRALVSSARGLAFSLAFTKNPKLANIFFSSSSAANKTYLNFHQAGAELCDEASKDGNDELLENLTSLTGGPAALFSRAYFIVGMPQEKAVSELMRLSGDCLTKDMRGKGKISLLDAIRALKETPGSKSKAILADYYKQLGKQIINHKLREMNTDTKKGLDLLYMVVLKQDIKRWMATCAKTGEWLMGSKEQDSDLLVALNGYLKKAGFSTDMDKLYFSPDYDRGI